MTNKSEKTTSGKKGRRSKKSAEPSPQGIKMEAEGSTVVRSNKPKRLRSQATPPADSHDLPLSLEKKAHFPIEMTRTQGLVAPAFSLKKMTQVAPSELLRKMPSVNLKTSLPLILGFFLLSSLAWPQEWLTWMEPNTLKSAENAAIQEEKTAVTPTAAPIPTKEMKKNSPSSRESNAAASAKGLKKATPVKSKEAKQATPVKSKEAKQATPAKSKEVKQAKVVKKKPLVQKSKEKSQTKGQAKKAFASKSFQ